MPKKQENKIAVLSLVLLLTAAVSVSVYSLFMRKTNRAENTFVPAVSVNPDIQEVFSGDLKENVCMKITDKGYPVYVRSAIVINWKDENGCVHMKKPLENTDYMLEIGDQWTKNTDDGFYYYQSPIQEGTTSPLIVTCRLIGEAPDEAYTLSVNIITQTIQAVGSTDEDTVPAHMDGWGVSLTQ